MSVFDDVRLNEYIEQGATGGPGFKTSIVTFSDGSEQRNQNWLFERGEWNVGYGIQTVNDLYAVSSFFRARRGKLRAFRFKDWMDYSAVNTYVATGNGTATAFQLVKTYSDDAAAYTRRIYKPVSGTVQVYVGGTPTSATINYATGMVTFGSAPANAAVITADFEFDVPVRFDTDTLTITQSTSDAVEVQSIHIVEINPLADE